MKFIDENDIEQINQFLNFDTSDCHITGGCDLFTTKPVGSDRKLYKTIDKHFDNLINQQNNQLNQNNQASNDNNHEIISPNEEFLEQKRRFSSSEVYTPYHQSSSSPRSLDSTPFGPLNQTASRRTFAYLIGILNATYPDYDFSSLEPTNFIKFENINKLKSKFENTLISLGKSSEEQNWIFDIINSHMDLNDCAIYELDLNSEDNNNSSSFLDDEPGHLWTFKWFIFNKKRKRVAFLYLNGFRLSSPKLHPNVSLNKRRLTIDHDDEEMEEYDLTYSDDDQNMYGDDDLFDEEAIEDEDDDREYDLNHVQRDIVGNIELET